MWLIRIVSWRLDHPPGTAARLRRHPAARPGTGISGDNKQQLQKEQILSTAKDLSQLTLGCEGSCHHCICRYNRPILLQEILFGPNPIHTSHTSQNAFPN